jgi:tripartite-type tricarboxylate transporter receptor subunit TctC
LRRPGPRRARPATTAKRLETLPDVPAVGEFVPGYEAAGWYGLGAPQGTPGEIINKLSEAMTGALADPKLKARLNDLGVAPMPMTPADFEKFIAAETDKWAKVIKTSGIKPE